MKASYPPDNGEWERISRLHYILKLQSFPINWKHKLYRRRCAGEWVYIEALGVPPPVLISSQDRRKAKGDRYKGSNRRKLGRLG